MSENNYKLKGEFDGEPSSGFKYGGTRYALTSKILSFEYPAGYHPFRAVFNFDCKDDGKFEATIRADKNFHKKNDADPVSQEKAICDLITSLETHCEMNSAPTAPVDAGNTASAKSTAKPDPNILKVSFFTDFDKEKKDEA